MFTEITPQSLSLTSVHLTSEKKAVGEEHEETTHSYHWLGIIQFMHRDYTSTTSSHTSEH